MVVTLEWIRDNYDTNRSRYIEYDETARLVGDIAEDRITVEQADAVSAAYSNHTLLPAYTHVTSFNIQTGATLKVGGVEVI